MSRREAWIPLAIIAVTVAFAFVCWLVRLSRGHPWLIRRKLRLGAMLLGLTAGASGCGGEGMTTCYLPALQDYVTFDADCTDESGLVLDLSLDNALTGHIEGRTADAYAFQVLAGGVEAVRGELVAVDGAFDTNAEEFRLVLAPDGLPAQTTLRVYRGPAAGIATARVLCDLPLTLIAAPGSVAP